MAHAVELGVTLVNGTIEVHKAEAGANTGMITTTDADLVFQPHGGKYSNLPKSHYN